MLDPTEHSALRVRQGAGTDYGDAVQASLAIPAEFARLACEYPILFRYDTVQRAFSALALFGFEAGENLYLEGNRWAAINRPLAMAVNPS